MKSSRFFEDRLRSRRRRLTPRQLAIPRRRTQSARNSQPASALSALSSTERPIRRKCRRLAPVGNIELVTNACHRTRLPVTTLATCHLRRFIAPLRLTLGKNTRPWWFFDKMRCTIEMKQQRYDSRHQNQIFYHFYDDLRTTSSRTWYNSVVYTKTNHNIWCSFGTHVTLVSIQTTTADVSAMSGSINGVLCVNRSSANHPLPSCCCCCCCCCRKAATRETMTQQKSADVTKTTLEKSSNCSRMKG